MAIHRLKKRVLDHYSVKEGFNCDNLIQFKLNLITAFSFQWSKGSVEKQVNQTMARMTQFGKSPWSTTQLISKLSVLAQASKRV